MSADTWVDPQYVTLAVAGTGGAGTVRFRGQKLTTYRRIKMITIESPIPGPGQVAIYHNGQLRATRTLAANMTAQGAITLSAGEEVSVAITDAVAGLKIKITAHSEDVALPDVAPPSFGFVDDTSGIIPSAVQRTYMLTQTENQLINAGGSVVPAGVNSADMRGFQAYRIFMTGFVNVGAAYCPMHCRLSWYDVRSDGFQSLVYREDFEFWAVTAAPGANQEAFGPANIYMQDQVHASFFTLELFNLGANQVMMEQIYVWGTNQPLNRYLHQMSPYDDMLAERNPLALPAGNLYYTIPLPLYYGDVGVHVKDAAAALVEVSFIWGSFGAVHLVSGVNNFLTTMVFPRRAGLLLLNRPAGAGNCQLYLTSRRDKI